MLFRKFQLLTQIVGSMTLVLLALYGLLALLGGHASNSWAAQQIANITGAPQKAPLSQWGDSTVPLVMNYSGYADDHEGKPRTGYYTMTFRIYDDVIATTTLWQEKHINVTVREGYFSVLLGNNTPLTNTLFTDPDRFIGVTVHPYHEMIPRQRLASMPYAMHSYHATKADHALQADHAIKAEQADRAYGLNAPDGEPQDALIVDAEGQIGVGTTIPEATLEISGSLKFGGRIIQRITYCTFDGIPNSNSNGIRWHHWVTEDCDNGLPQGNCIGFLTKAAHWGRDEDWQVLLPGEIGYVNTVIAPNGGMEWAIVGSEQSEKSIAATYFCSE